MMICTKYFSSNQAKAKYRAMEKTLNLKQVSASLSPIEEHKHTYGEEVVAARSPNLRDLVDEVISCL